MSAFLIYHPSSISTIVATSAHGGRSRFSSPNLASPPRKTCFSSKDSVNSVSPGDNAPSNFCIIEGPDTVQDFVQMQIQEIQDNINSRRNKIFLLMEEVKFVERVFCDVKDFGAALLDELFNDIWDYSLRGLLAPSLELKLGLGGTSYEDFIRSMHLPLQLSQVDPIVASFAGGAVGVISALMLIEANNVIQQQQKRCKYCHGTGYLACARCSASGVCLKTEPISISGDPPRLLQAPTAQRCTNCSGAGKVMCPTCLCTGMIMASEHDPRIDPFD